MKGNTIYKIMFHLGLYLLLGYSVYNTLTNNSGISLLIIIIIIALYGKYMFKSTFSTVYGIYFRIRYPNTVKRISYNPAVLGADTNYWDLILGGNPDTVFGVLKGVTIND